MPLQSSCQSSTHTEKQLISVDRRRRGVGLRHLALKDKLSGALVVQFVYLVA